MDDDLVVLRPEGLYCPAGDFFIDPWRAVPRAVITHAHADHARRGHGHYLASAAGAGLLRVRLGDLPLQTLDYGEAVEHQGVRISLHPAGHVLGSAQVRLAHRHRVWVVSGDYHVSGVGADNPTCTPFEPVRCDCFITESTFGLPVYRWRPEAVLRQQINTWWLQNAQAGRASLLMGYSLGKAQRLLAGLDLSIGPVFVHRAVDALNQAYRAAGVALPPTRLLDERVPAAELRQALVIAPPTGPDAAWRRTLGEHRDAFASGWMQVRGQRRRRGVDRGFVVSDHADWPGLLAAIQATGCARVIVTHGADAVLVRHLQQQGLPAASLLTPYSDDPDAADAATGAETA